MQEYYCERCGAVLKKTEHIDQYQCTRCGTMFMMQFVVIA